MKRFIAMLLTLLCLCGLMTACGGSAEKDVTALPAELLAELSFTDSLEQLDPAVVELIYGLSAADWQTCSVYCGTGATAEEIALFRAADEAAADRIAQAIDSRVAAQLEAYKNYGPSDTLMLEDVVTRRNGLWVVLVVSGDAKAADVVDSYF